MRFTENGPNIPDDLLVAQDKGGVIFFCGAGVSRAFAGLPDFGGLTEQVLKELGEHEDGRVYKRYEAFRNVNSKSETRGLVSADHVFGGLRRSFADEDIEYYVAQSLKLPKPVDKESLKAHKVLLRLSTQPNGDVRLVTTNFDLLFEECDHKIQAITKSQFSTNTSNWGIVHLHGRVNADYTGASTDGFVLSSAEFGEAYLASGWANEFVKNIFENYTPVFIGYSADDPPIKYLLEGLEKKGWQKRIYAFQSAGDDEAILQWREKGVVPITYDKKENHKELWKTLEKWSERTKNPNKWKEKILRKAAGKPKDLARHERGIVAHILKTASGAKFFSEMTPPPSAEWLCVFDDKIRLSTKGGDKTYPYLLDSDPVDIPGNEFYSTKSGWNAFEKTREELAFDAQQISGRIEYMYAWLYKILNQPMAPWWAAQQPTLPRVFVNMLWRHLAVTAPANMKPAIWKAWQRVLHIDEQKSEQIHSSSMFFLRSNIEWNQNQVRLFLKYTKPTLSIRDIKGEPPSQDGRHKIAPSQMVPIDFQYPEQMYGVTIKEASLLEVVQGLQENISQFEKLCLEYYSYPLRVCSLFEPDGEGYEFSRTYGSSGYINFYIGFFKRLLKLNPDAARREAMSWKKDSYLFNRLRLWASAQPQFVAEAAFTDDLINSSSDFFWGFRESRDILLALQKRWEHIPHKSRQALTKKLLKGPPQPSGMSQKEYIPFKAVNVLDRLFWLKNNGCELGIALEEIASDLKTRCPEWSEQSSKSAARSTDSRGGVIKRETDPMGLERLPPRDVIPFAKDFARRDYDNFIEYMPFVGLVKSYPLKAFTALTQEYRKGNFELDLWKDFLREADLEKLPNNLSYRLKVSIVQRLCRLEVEDFTLLQYDFAQWFNKNSIALTQNPETFFLAWNALLISIKNEPKQGIPGETDWITKALNSSVGNLAHIHVKIFEKKIVTKARWQEMAKELLSLSETSRNICLVFYGRFLGYFYSHAQRWAQSTIVRSLQNNNPASWAGFFWGASVPQRELFIEIKEALLSYGVTDSSYSEVLAGIVLCGWLSNQRLYISNQEFRSLMLNMDEDFRLHVLHQVKLVMSKRQKLRPKMQRKLIVFIDKVWPKQKHIKSHRSTEALLRLAFFNERVFNKIGGSILRLVGKCDSEYIHLGPLLDNNGDQLWCVIKTDPELFLRIINKVLPDTIKSLPYGLDNFIEKMMQEYPCLLKSPELACLRSKVGVI